MIGRTVSHYRIVEELGRGGMGVVFKAHDLQLGRTVALKFISENRSDHPDAFDRLWGEARAASTLNHPNICTIYEVGQDGDSVFIAMEYIEGETLRQRIASKPLQITELLDLGIKIADGLNAAHEKKIIHRDIKSANILITPRGDIKIMDFGIAKRIASEDDSVVPHDGPTDTLPLLALSRPGVIPGTLSYMSPEQTRGDELDQRSDLFSFGVVLYEMVTGTLPFQGTTTAVILEAIQARLPVPPLSRRPDLPAELQPIIDTALEKDRDLRFQTASEMRAALARVKRQFSTDGPFQTRRPTEELKTPKSPRLTLVLIAAGLVILTGLGLLVWKLRPTSKPGQLGFLHTAQFSSGDGLDINASFSPDGKLVAYASDRTGSFEIYVRSRETGANELQLTNKGSQCMFPRFSPDGQSLVFSSASPAGLFRIPALGGTARRLTEFGTQPVWSPDGNQIAFVSHAGASLSTTDYYFPRDDSSIWLVSADGGTPRRITLPDKPAGGQTFPSWSPDGKEIRFINYSARKPSLWTYRLSDGALEKRFGREDRSTLGSPVFARDGRMFYVSSTLNGDIGIWQLRLNPRTLKPEAEPEPFFRPGGLGVPRDLSLAPDGKHLVYSAVLASSQLLVQNMNRNEPEGKPFPITHGTSYRYAQPKWFPDSKGLVYTRWQTGERAQIWQVKLDGSPQSPVSPDNASQFFGQPLNDGQSVVFISFPTPGKITFRLASIADGSARTIGEVPDNSTADQPNFAIDGSAVVFHDSAQPVLHLYKLDFKTAARTQLTFGFTPTGYAHFSPDSKWISVQVIKQENTEIGVMPSSGGPIETLWDKPGRWFNGGWSPDSERILIAGDDGRGWAINAFSRKTRQMQQLTKELPLRMYLRYPEWSPDGKHMVYEFNESKGNVFLAELQ